MSRLKAISPTETTPRKPKIVVFGGPGVGKTFWALSFPDVYYIDTEGGATRGPYIEKLKSAGGVYMGPDQGSQDFQNVINEIQTLATEKHGYKTVVIDSISKLYNLEIFNEADRLKGKDLFGASKKPAILLMRKLINWIDKIDMNVIMIAHEKPKREKEEVVGYTFDGWEKLEYELDLVIKVNRMQEKRVGVIYKSRLEGFPNESSFPWAYEDFAVRYGKEIIEKQGSSLELASAESLQTLLKTMTHHQVSTERKQSWLDKARVSSFEEMTSTQINKIINYLQSSVVNIPNQ